MRGGFSPALLNWIRRVPSPCRLIPEACVVTAADLRQRKDQWALEDGIGAGFELRDDGSVALEATATAVLTNATQNARWRSTDRRHQRPDLQVVSITRAGATVTVTIESFNGLVPITVTIAGADQADYNGTHTITVTSATTFTFTTGATPVSPATGVLTALAVLLSADTELLRNGGVFRCAKIVLNGTQDPEVEVQDVRAYLDPNAGTLGSTDVRWWECHLFSGFQPVPDRTTLIPVGDPVRMLAPAAAGDVTFDFSAVHIKPKQFVNAGANFVDNYVLYVVIYALDAAGGLAHNCGWGRDSGTASLTTTGNVLTGVELTEVPGAPELWAETDLLTIPTMRLRLGSYSAATLVFATEPGNVLDLGATPTGTVEFVAQGNVPTGCSINYQVRNDADSGWLAFVDGDTSETVGVSKRQTYKMQVALDPGVGATMTPVLRALGVREITRTCFDGLCTVKGDQGALDPLTLQGKVGEITIAAIEDGEQDYMDAIADLLAQYFLADIEWRVWVGFADSRADLAAHRCPDGTPWGLIDAYRIDDYAGNGAAIELTCVSPLALLKADLPVFDEGTATRTPVEYQAQTLRAAYDDIIDGQLGLDARYCGARPEDATTRVSKVIAESDCKVELDALTYLAGYGHISSQGRLQARDMFGTKAVVARIPRDEIKWGPVSPGFRNRVPEYFVPYDYDVTSQDFQREVRGFHGDALLRLGRTRIDPPNRLDQASAEWIRSVGITSATRAGTVLTVNTANDHGLSDGDLVTILGSQQDNYNVDGAVTVVDLDTFTIVVTNTGASPATGTMTVAILPHRIANRTTRYLGPGMTLLPLRLNYRHPELEVGDMIAVETDQFIGRDPTQTNRSIRGRVWIKAVIQAIQDLEGTALMIWMRSWSDIVPTTVSGERQKVARVKVYNTTDQTVATSTARVAMNAEEVDDGEMHDLVTNNDLIFIREAGRYSVTAQVHYKSLAAGGKASVSLFSTSAVLANRNLYGTPPAEDVFQLSAVVDLVPGDFVYLLVDAGSPACSITIDGGASDTWLSVYKINTVTIPGGFRPRLRVA